MPALLCPLCSVSLPPSSLESHLRRELAYAPLACLLCRRRFLDDAAARQHFHGPFAQHPGREAALLEDRDAEVERRLAELLRKAGIATGPGSGESEHPGQRALICEERDEAEEAQPKALLRQSSSGATKVEAEETKAVGKGFPMIPPNLLLPSVDEDSTDWRSEVEMYPSSERTLSEGAKSSSTLFAQAPEISDDTNGLGDKTECASLELLSSESEDSFSRPRMDVEPGCPDNPPDESLRNEEAGEECEPDVDGRIGEQERDARPYRICAVVEKPSNGIMLRRWGGGWVVFGGVVLSREETEALGRLDPPAWARLQTLLQARLRDHQFTLSTQTKIKPQPNRNSLEGLKTMIDGQDVSRDFLLCRQVPSDPPDLGLVVEQGFPEGLTWKEFCAPRNLSSIRNEMALWLGRPVSGATRLPVAQRRDLIAWQVVGKNRLAIPNLSHIHAFFAFLGPAGAGGCAGRGGMLRGKRRLAELVRGLAAAERCGACGADVAAHLCRLCSAPLRVFPSFR